ncbi:MAG: HU family DNA-binding protein [Anaerolineales bacterium]|jgi:predicted histone-like DNA-binding protein|nr:HU family DNA-binding protein [Anaerolineales bacterium]
MTVKFNVVERGNPSNPAAPKKFYPSIESSGRKTLRQMAGRISEISTVSSADTMAVLEALLTTIPQELAAGNIVELGDFGNFWLRGDSEGAETAADVRASSIKGVLPRFNAGKEFKKVLDTIEFEKA